MKLWSLWPLLFIQLITILVTAIFVRGGKNHISWRYLLICSLSMMIAEVIIIMKYKLWLLSCEQLTVAGIPAWLLLFFHTGYFSDVSGNGRQWIWHSIAFIVSGAGMLLYWWLWNGTVQSPSY